MKNIKYIFVLISFLLWSCQKEDTLNTQLDGIYSTQIIQVEPALDLNRDGILSSNLLDEKHPMLDSSDFDLNLSTNSLTESQHFTISFPFLHVNENTTPYSFNEGMDVIFGEYKQQGKKLLVDNSEIISVLVVNDSTIEMVAQKEFYSQGNFKNVEMKATYTRRK